MKRIVNLFLLVCLSHSLVYAQLNYQYNETEGSAVSKEKTTNANISGHTIDKKSADYLGFITITIKGTTIGTATDATGHFYLKNLPVGDYTLVASAVGYKTIEQKMKFSKEETLDITLKMEEDAIMLDNVVVSANRNESKRRDASNVVNVLTGRLFEITNSVCLVQGLGFQPGLRVENSCQNCSSQQVRINGLEGSYSQVLIDSRPIFSALAGVYGLEQIPANMIDRVEVVRGGGSALYGSNAIAGTINIITKEPLNNSLTLNNSSMLIGGSKADINTSINAALVSDNYKAGVSIYSSTRQRDAWDANNDGFSEIGLIRARNVGFKSYFKTSLQSKLTLEYHNLGEFRRGGNKLDLPAHKADITELTDHNINSGGLKWEFFTPDYKHKYNVYTSGQKTDRLSYYGVGQDPNAYGKTDDFAFVSGMQYAYAMEKLLLMPADFTIGAEYSYNKLTDLQVAYDRNINQMVNIQSVFAQNEWKNKKLSLLVGMRFDKHNLIDKPIYSPRVNLRYNPSESVNLRAGYASGFRAPQTFDEDLHITSVGGEVQLIKLDPNLKPESSKSYSVSSDFYKAFGKVQTNLLIEGFYTDIQDVFYLDEMGIDNLGNTILMRKNGSGAVVRGVNMELKVVPSLKYNLQAGFSFQKSLYKEAQTWSENPNLAANRQMFRSPDTYGYLTFSYQPTKVLSISVNGTYSGSMLVQHYGVNPEDDEEVNTPEFYDLNTKIAYTFSLSAATKIQLNAGVQNIFNSFQRDFDKGETRDAGYIYGPSLPRSVYLGLKFSM